MKKTSVTVKKDIVWYYAMIIINAVENLGVYFTDKGFHNLVLKMQNYINRKLALPKHSEIKDMYVSIELDVHSTEAEG